MRSWTVATSPSVQPAPLGRANAAAILHHVRSRGGRVQSLSQAFALLSFDP